MNTDNLSTNDHRGGRIKILARKHLKLLRGFFIQLNLETRGTSLRIRILRWRFPEIERYIGFGVYHQTPDRKAGFTGHGGLIV